MDFWQIIVTISFIVLFGMWLAGAVENRVLRNQVADYRTMNQELRTQHFANRRELEHARHLMALAINSAAEMERKGEVIETMNRFLAADALARQEAAEARRAKRKGK